ncbi:glycosyltransferase [Georgenia daeguensis]|uniref:Glycosyl transferase family 1 domain-containing protein n=1 Tax=Georgenia daeguensis TaxID=908355 RepID=A0ABP8EVU0_9MICO
MPKRITLQYSGMPAYRQPFLDELVRRQTAQDLQYTFLIGDAQLDPTVTTEVTGSEIKYVRNRYLFGRRALWQIGVVRACTASDLAILELNPRIASTWTTLVLRRLARKPSLMWGHAWPRAGRQARSDALRSLMRRLGRNVVTYTHTQADELRSAEPGLNVYVAPNAIAPSANMLPITSTGPDVVYSGRLVPQKKPNLLLEGYARALHIEPSLGRLKFIGDGPMLDELKAKAEVLGLRERVSFAGRVTDQMNLRQHYGLFRIEGVVGGSSPREWCIGPVISGSVILRCRVRR